MEAVASHLRIAIVGAESTGKTTLCEHLARVWSTVWAHEFGRDFTVALADRFGGLESIQWSMNTI
jgi:nicotinamide riboside kinase